MWCKEILKLASVCFATLILVFTLQEIALEDWKNDPINNIPQVRDLEADEKTEPEQLEKQEPIVCTIQEEIQEMELGMCLDAVDEEILMKIAMSEAEGESTEGKALVMLSVLNRVGSDDFPNTVPGVVFQNMQYSPVLDGRYYSTTPDDDCLAALKLIESGWDESMGAMYFENAGVDSWHRRNLEFLFQEGNHKFYK